MGRPAYLALDGRRREVGKGKGRGRFSTPARIFPLRKNQDKREKRCWFRTLEDDQVTKAKTRRPSELVLFEKEEGGKGGKRVFHAHPHTPKFLKRAKKGCISNLS